MKRQKLDPAFTIHRKELIIGELAGRTAFSNGFTKEMINPANPALFPWLAGIARYFSEYVIRKLSFRFKSRRANEVVGGNPAEGSIIMAFVSNTVSDAVLPRNKQDMENIFGCKSGNPCYDLSLNLKIQPNVLKRKFVTHPNVVNDGDSRVDMEGFFLLATSGGPDGVVIGDVFADYVIDLYRPKENPVLRTEFPEDPFNGKWEIWDLDTIDENTPFGNSTLRGGNIGTSLTTTTLSFPANLTGKCYRIIWWIADGGTPFIIGVNNPPATTPVNCTDTTTHWPDGSGNLTWSTLFSDPGNFAAAIWTIRIDADGATYSVITPWKVSVAPLAYGMLEITEISATMAPF